MLVTLDSEILVLSGFVLESHNIAFYTIAAPNPRSTRAAREILHQVEHLPPLGLLLRTARVNFTSHIFYPLHSHNQSAIFPILIGEQSADPPSSPASPGGNKPASPPPRAIAR